MHEYDMLNFLLDITLPFAVALQNWRLSEHNASTSIENGLIFGFGGQKLLTKVWTYAGFRTGGRTKPINMDIFNTNIVKIK